MGDSDSNPRDAAFMWETEALRSSPPRTVPGATRAPERDAVSTDWLTLRQAADITGIPISTLRKWARRDSIPTYLEETPTGHLRMVSIEGVRERADLLGRADHPAPAQPETPAPPAPPPPPVTSPPPAAPPVTPAGFVPPAEPETPPGTMLVPIEAWDKMLLQLGNLHEAGQQLAEARERAAKAETEARFLRERLAEMRSDLAEARSSEPPRSRQRVYEERPTEPIAHIAIEAEDEDDLEPDDGEIEVRDLGKSETAETEGSSSDVDDGDLTIGEYSLEIAKHIYSTWRGRPRR